MTGKETLTDLAEGAKPIATPLMPMPARLDPKKVINVDRTKVAKPAKKDQEIMGSGNQMYDAAFEAIPNTIERLRQQSLFLIKKGEEMRIEEKLKQEESEEQNKPKEKTQEELKREAITFQTSKPINNINNIIDDDDGIDFGPEDDDDDFEF